MILKEAMKICSRVTSCIVLKRLRDPDREWLKGRLNPLLHDMLEPTRIKEQGLFNADYVQKLISEHENGKASHHKELWTLLVFQLWQQNFLPRT